jgi:cyclic pyranopterin phosphate synthase
MRVSRTNGGYSAFFDTKYFQGVVPSMPGARLGEASDVAAWLAALSTLKQAMDLAQPGEEREVQQLILRDNNLGCIARSTDYYVCDIEYANHHGRFDLVAVRWPSTPTARKKQDGHRLVLGEVKVGDGALEGTAGLHAHVDDVNGYLAAPGNLAAIKEEMLRVFNQKRALGLVDCEKDLTGFAIASGSIHMRAETLASILEERIEKGDVFSVARVAGIMAAKKTSELIPMCHPLNITSVEIELTPRNEPARVDIEATVRVSGKTGVEMEAMTAVAVAALTIYDMCKAVDREMTISEIRLVKKSGGKSGTFVRKE